MLYTLGRKDIYEPQINHPDFAKGIGGSVWRTKKEAEYYLEDNPDFNVYGVLADWDNDVIPGKKFGDLKFERKIVKLV